MKSSVGGGITLRHQGCMDNRTLCGTVLKRRPQANLGSNFVFIIILGMSAEKKNLTVVGNRLVVCR